MKLQFVEDEQNEASEPLIPKEKSTDFKTISEPKEILSAHDIKESPIISKPNFVGQNNTKTNPTIPKTNNICPKCNKRIKITQDKSMNKDEIIQWFTTFINRNKDNFTLDWLRGQKLTFESIYEMRK